MIEEHAQEHTAHGGQPIQSPKQQALRWYGSYLVAAELAAADVIPLDPQLNPRGHPLHMPPVDGGGQHAEPHPLLGHLPRDEATMHMCDA